jgi:hypothetical protein
LCLTQTSGIGFLKDSQNAGVQDEIASVIFPHWPYILIGAIAIAGIGTWTGWLPGTGTKKSEK